MFVKLALRNVKRQLSNYAVYFTTVMITIALIFSVVNVAFCSDLIKPVTNDSSVEDDIKSKGVMVAMIIISAVISLIISRAQIFILGIRKRELGTYKLLGMKNKNIIKIFIAETGIIYILTTICGMVLGLFFYQGLNSILAKFIGTTFELTGYSFKSVYTTVGLALIVFAVSAFSSAEYLKKSDINQLISNRRKKESRIGRSSYKLGTVLCIISVMVWAILMELIRESIGIVNGKNAFIVDMMEKIFNVEGDGTEGIISIIVIGITFIAVPVTVVLFNMAYPRCLVNLLQKNKKLSSRGANTFILRQLSSKSNSNASMFGAISVLLTFTVILICLSVNLREVIIKSVDMGYDLQIDKQYEEKTDEIISEFTGVKEKAEVKTYFVASITDHTWTRAVSVSDVSEILKVEGKKFDFGDGKGIYVSLNSSIMNNENYGIINTDGVLNKSFKYNDIDISPWRIVESDILIPNTLILPDEILNMFLTEDENIRNMDMVYYLFDGSDYDIEAMEKALNDGSDYIYFRDAFIKHEFLGVAPVFMILLFCIVSFIILSMAIIGMKASSEVSEDRLKYQKLYQIGVNKKMLCSILMKQTALFFVFPLVQPVIFSFFTSYIFRNMFSLITGNDITSDNQIILTMSFAGIIYLTYFIITYNFLKKKIIMEKEQRKVL